MSDILFNLIRDHVYNEDLIQKVSLNSSDKKIRWIFNFKNQSLSKIFLDEFSKVFWGVFPELENVQIGGMEAGAIPLVTAIALNTSQNISLRSFYIRKSRKKNDLANLVEGELLSDVPIILVDDILNKGDTMERQVKILENYGHKVSAIFVCLRYRDIKEYEGLLSRGIKIYSIFDLNSFERVLPVKNITPITPAVLLRRYAQVYKLKLTEKPNLYLVLPKSAPLLKKDLLYYAADDGMFFCVKSVDGGVVWSRKIFFGSRGKRIFSSPEIYDDKIIFGAYDGNLYCINRFTGKTIWVFMDADWIGSSPCINYTQGIVYVGLEFGLFKKQGGLVAIDINTGKELWKNYSISEFVHASPGYNTKNNLVICGSNNGYVYSFNAKNGHIVWEFKTEGEIKYGVSFTKDLTIVASMDGYVYLLYSESGVLYHKFSAEAGFYSTPLVYDNNFLIAGSLDKKIYCFNIGKYCIIP